MAGMLIAKYYSEQREATGREMDSLRHKHPIASRVRRKTYRSGVAYADDDGNYSVSPGSFRVPDTKNVRHFSGNVYLPKGVDKHYDGPRRVAPPSVGKRLVDEERHTSIPRMIGLGSGMGAVAWGGSRMRMLGRGMRLGATHPDIDHGIRRVFIAAEAARSATERSTRPLGVIAGRGYGHLPPNVRASLDKVPPGLRPATSALIGAIMVEQSRPVRRTSYRPVAMQR